MPGSVFNFRGKPWRVIFAKRMSRNHNGYAMPSAKREGGTIRVRATLEGKRRMEVLIHEMIHACHWDLDESAVTETARDIAEALWELGYR